ncbi:high mobility group nucleosome-binding domain-containing protein 3-like isoform X2 [Osmerus eperlanus]|uniref:high mobility group nucleosome-binding domain-containing protein 3-like isoform X2 n=1 Tax=Osmerus eperlanus TaxID=29151 RepID=UPI002E146A35
MSSSPTWDFDADDETETESKLIPKTAVPPKKRPRTSSTVANKEPDKESKLIPKSAVPPKKRPRTSSTVANEEPGAVKGQKMPWRPEERDAVFQHLGKYITLQRVPGKTECMACLNKEPTLHRRSWKDVKNYLHNSIQSMKKKMARDEAGLKDKK